MSDIPGMIKDHWQPIISVLSLIGVALLYVYNTMKYKLPQILKDQAEIKTMANTAIEEVRRKAEYSDLNELQLEIHDVKTKAAVHSEDIRIITKAFAEMTRMCEVNRSDCNNRICSKIDMMTKTIKEDLTELKTGQTDVAAKVNNQATFIARLDEKLKAVKMLAENANKLNNREH